jgi:hypothetical protein
MECVSQVSNTPTTGSGAGMANPPPPKKKSPYGIWIDPYAPSAPNRDRDPGAPRDKSNFDSPAVMSSSKSREDLGWGPAPTRSPRGLHPRAVPLSHQSSEDSVMREESGRNEKPVSIRQRLLPNIYIESEIGQADKHMLKNVTGVERFIRDVIRKSIVEELVFPNFHTLILEDEPQWLRWDVSLRSWTTCSCTRPAVIVYRETLRLTPRSIGRRESFLIPYL